jgi:hypothetical protein
MADTIQAALQAAGLGAPNAPARPRKRQPAPEILPPRREVTRELDPTLRLELKAALTRNDLSGLVWISGHAIQRFRERFEPGSSLEEARFSLTARVSRGRWHSARPWWVSLERGSGSDAPLENVGYIVGGEGDDEIVLPLDLTGGRAEPLSAVTCLYPTPPDTGSA